jgi:hypothetical protein
LFAGPTFPSPLTTAPTVNGASALSLQMLDPNIKTPYSEQANIGIQRQLPWQTALTVSYIWSRGVQLYGIRDLNLPSTTTNYTYTINDANNTAVGTYTTPVLTGTRPDTRYGQISYGENGVNSYYNGLAVMVNKRFDHGLQLLGSYTWSHEIDDGQSYGESTNNLWLSSPTYWLGNGNYAGDKGNGTLDQRHRASLSWVWAPTFMHSQSAIAKYLVNGWQLSSITTMGSGHPYGSVQAYLNDKPVTGMFGYSLNGTGFSYRVPWQPVNGYMYPATYRSDARLSKSIAVSEKDRLVLNLECFNLSNSWFATGYTNSRMYNETKGVLTPAALYVPSAAYGSPDGTQARRYQISARFTF